MSPLNKLFKGRIKMNWIGIPYYVQKLRYDKFNANMNKFFAHNLFKPSFLPSSTFKLWLGLDFWIASIFLWFEFLVALCMYIKFQCSDFQIIELFDPSHILHLSLSLVCAFHHYCCYCGNSEWNDLISLRKKFLWAFVVALPFSIKLKL